jgi:putative peptidoglycan lipid II flippase
MPALAPCALNVALILFALAAWATGVNVAVAMSVAVLVGGAVQLAMQQRPLGRTGFAWRGDWALGDPGVKRVGRLMLPTVLGAAVYQINIVLITLLASFLPVGSISYLYYADRLVQLPLGVVAQAVSTAALPNLSALAADRDEAGFAKTLDSALGFSMFLALPATAGLLALSQTIIATLFGHGEFDRTAVLASSEALLAFGVGLPAIAFYRPLVSAFYALENSRTPVRIAILCMVVNVLAGWGLMQGMAHAGLALAVSIAAWLNGALLTVALSRKLGRTPGLTRSVGLSLVLSVALYAGVRLTAGWGWPALVIIPAWAVAYIGAARALGVEEAHMAVGFARRLRDKVRRRG